MTRAQMKERVQLYVRNRPNYDATINLMLNERVDALAMPFFFPNLDLAVAAATISGTATVAIPSTLYVVKSIVNLDVPTYRAKRKVIPVTSEISEYDVLDATYEEVPKMAVQFGTNLYLWPTPDAVYDLTLRGRRLPTPMADDADEPELPRDWHPIICKLTASELHFALGEDERGMQLKNEALGEISTRQEVVTMQRRGQEGQIQIEKKYIYRRGSVRGILEE